MEPIYVLAESTVKPLTIEVGVDTVYLRKDITEESRTDMDGKTVKYWTYQEAKMTPEEFNKYSVMLNVINTEELINHNNELLEQSANIAIDTEYLVCLAEISSN